jgi:DNA polymerase-3 subunit alpha
MLFERFIDPTRTDLPDIDIDFEDERRGEVIAYAQRKYGYDRVANILDFVKYRARNSIDDIATVYRLPEWKAEAIKSRVVDRAEGHPRFADSIQDTIDNYEDLQALVEETPELLYATKLEGNQRHSSFHPAAVVIASVPLNQICATYAKQSGTDQGSGVAYDKKDAEYLGLLKLDFLSLRTLSGIAATLRAIDMTVDQFYALPLDDPKVFAEFRKGNLLGIFQFEGWATRRVTKAVNPTNFMDLVDINALSRPGGDDKAYVRNKARIAADPKALDGLHPIVREHLGRTFGTIVYQEQILLLLRDLGNFEPAATNKIRKAISAKQDATVFNTYRQQFLDGAKAHGMDVESASSIWDLVVAASGYAFNVGHAVPYTDTAYRQMWLKVYHPEFYLGQLLKCPDDKEGLERRKKLIIEAEHRGIKCNPPDLGLSQAGWALVGGELYAGFLAIKGIGPAIANAIVEWRKQKLQASLNDPDQFWIAHNLEWESLLDITGIGPGRISTIRDFCESDDPFGILATKRTMDRMRECFHSGEFPNVPYPTHSSLDITQEDELVTFMGVLKKKQYKDVVEQRLKYGPQDLTREAVLEDLDNPHLLKYAVLTVEDEHDEPIRVRVSRKMFPQYAGLIRDAKAGQDVIVAKGYVSNYGGIGIQVKEMVVIDPE